MGVAAPDRFADRQRAHRLVQEARPGNYVAEAPLAGTVTRQEVVLEVRGRADGISWGRDGAVVLEEIKTTQAPLGEIAGDNPVHWGQALAYAHLLCLEKGLDGCAVQLTYFQLDTGEMREFVREHDAGELAAFFENLSGGYLDWLVKVAAHRDARDASLADMGFPYSGYRPGQRDLAVAVYRTVAAGGHLIATAPTGCGKTMATLFPALKALSVEAVDRVFYLTARNTGKAAATEALAHMETRGLCAAWVVLTAKEKICPLDEVLCDPETCPRAPGHYDRINAALAEIFARGAAGPDTVVEVSTEQRVCPFELGLEMAAWADVIVGDYNYVFDPRVGLKRLYSATGTRHAFLVDEAHNMPDRAREMHSARLSRRDLEAARTLAGATPAVARALSHVLDWYSWTESRVAENRHRCVDEPPAELVSRIGELVRAGRRAGPAVPGRDLALFLEDAAWFSETARRFDERLASCFEVGENDSVATLYCLDPSERIARTLKNRGPVVWFSATMEPMDYFARLLGSPDAVGCRLPSPFPEHNVRRIICDRISTRFHDRERTAAEVARVIRAMALARRGNYFVFVPSYRYLDTVLGRFRRICPEVDIQVQAPRMSEQARADFLEAFSRTGERSMVAFAAMGGVFGEGIDLVGDRLSGAAVVGVGLPPPSAERDLIRDYHEREDGAGFAYAYQDPGMNRVLQAAGRVIRSASDRGVLVFIDERFSRPSYKRLFPPEWRLSRAQDANDVERLLARFWKEADGARQG